MKLGETHKMPKRCCPICGAAHDAATNLDSGSIPKPGDLTICISCGYVMAFTDDLSFRKLTEPKQAEAYADPRILNCTTAIAMMNSAKARSNKRKAPLARQGLPGRSRSTGVRGRAAALARLYHRSQLSRNRGSSRCVIMKTGLGCIG